MTQFIDLTPASFRAAGATRRQVRMWIGVYTATALVLTALHLAANTGRTQREYERAALDAQLKLEWDRNEEAKRLLKEVQGLDGNITRYDRLASSVRASDVVATVTGMLPEDVSLTAITLTPRQEKVALAPGQARAQGKAGAAQTRTIPQLILEIEGVSPDDAQVSALVSGLESSELFSQVALEYARSMTIHSVSARTFRVSGRVDLSNHYQFRSVLGEAGAERAGGGEGTP